jgi:hypothetical protein
MQKPLKGLLPTAALIFCFILISFYSEGCSDEPSSLGLNLVPPGDTGGVRIFDTNVDTMQITMANPKKNVNTSASQYLMVGKTGNYDSKALLQFYNLSRDYDSATVNSATITLRYHNYYFPSAQSDSLGQINFDVYKIQKSLTLSTVTLDSVDNNTFGNISQGSYTGTPADDSEEVNISLNTSMVKDWLEYSADTSYPNKNYGIVLSTGISSSVIKGFYSRNTDLKPRLQIIVTKNSDTDTLYYDVSATTSLANNTMISPTNELFFLQSGIAYVGIMKFDMTRLPSTATINDVQLYLTMDPTSSILSNKTLSDNALNKLGAARVTDTAGLQTEVKKYFSSSPANNVFTLRLVSSDNVSPFQRWLTGETNYGLFLYPFNMQSNLDMYAIYNVIASDPSKRPRLVIKYTPRTTP